MLMIDNYAREDNGVIFQIEREEFVYDSSYVARAYGAAPQTAMSNLRLGYLIGSIGHIPSSLLDVGYGSGAFLTVAQHIGPKVFGYDVPPQYPLEGVELVESIFDREYEVVTFFDSLEHFEDIYCIKNLKAD